MPNTKHSSPFSLKMGGLLIAVSMLLLTAFQGFWLYKEYNEQKNILQKETDILFRNTVQALEEAAFQKQIAVPMQRYEKTVDLEEVKRKNTPKKVKNTPRFVAKIDSTVSPQIQLVDVLKTANPSDIQAIKMSKVGNVNTMTFTVNDTASPQRKKVVLVMKSFPQTDTIRQLLGKIARIVMINRSKNDSLKTPQKEPVQDFKMSFTVKQNSEKPTEKGVKPANDQLFINLSEKDSLKVKDIAGAYKQKLQTADIPLAFEIQRTLSKKIKNQTGSILPGLATSSVATSIPIGRSFTAIFPDYGGYLFKKIIPQGLFSFFLLAIVGLAFGAIFRNLQQQRRLTQLKNDFISNVTHELKTPIATVSVAIEALQNFGVAQNPQQTKEYLDISKNELNRLTLLVDKILKMATFEQQGLDLNREPLNMTELVQQVMASMKIQFEKHGAAVHLTNNVEAGWVNGDKIHLTNVVYNLLDNALKYSSEKPKIWVELRGNESKISLLVRDEGIGIAPEYQDKVFEKFFRVPTGNTHNVKGYGLGLSYVDGVMRQHGGQASVKSEPEKGSTFVVTLPRL
ncbi:MAG: sensor histidine kinase [Runella slithyformis]|nr:MAG: sensor histidine kinase [Runella slithyformis]TAF24327.1 MAG: sensor histidine kinase [Runella slithyformis]TAF43473.1 MAG: sensor histidine kinase [Runella slithyformis]TAF81203.1 MAG: sensor histidine kinase [Runella slithyformis]